MAEASRPCPMCGVATVPGGAYCHRCGTSLVGLPASAGLEGTSAPSKEGLEEEPEHGGRREPEGPGGVGHESASFGDLMSEPGSSPDSTDPAEPLRDAGATSPADDAAMWMRDGQGEPDGSRAPGAPPGGQPSGAQAASASGGPDATTGGPQPETDPGLARALRGDYSVRIGDWMSRGWAVFTRYGGLFIGFAAITWLVVWFAAPLLVIFLPMLISGHLAAALRARTGTRLRFSDFWLPFNDFLPLLLVWLVWLALFTVGLVLTCGLLTVYLGVAYQFRYLLILDRRMDFWEALEASRRATTNRNWPALLAFALLMLGINVVAFLVTASIGLIVSLPLTSCVLVEAYADIFGVKGGLARIEPMTASSQPVSA